MREKTCPRCRGKGTQLEPEDARYFGGGFGFNVGNRMVTVVCRLCKGTGKVER